MKYIFLYTPDWIDVDEYEDLITDIGTLIDEDDNFDVYSPHVSDDLGELIYNLVTSSKPDLSVDRTCELCNALHPEFINYYNNK